VNGQAYIVGSPATGAWAGHEGDVAIPINGQWYFVDPHEGLFMYDQALNKLMYWNGSAWVEFTGGGGGTGTVTSISQGTGIILTPNPITTTGSVAADPEYIRDIIQAIMTDSSSIDFTISDPGDTITASIIDEYIYDLVQPMFVDSSSIDFTTSDPGNTITAAIIDEYVEDLINSFLVQGTGITLTYNAKQHAGGACSLVGVTDGDKGEIIVASSGTLWTMDITGLTTNAGVDTAADYIPYYDASAAANRKALISDIRGANSANDSAMQWVGSDTRASPGTTLTVSGLDLAADGEYYCVLVADNGSGAGSFSYSLFFNNDTTAANYDTERDGSNGASQGSAGANNALWISGLATGQQTVARWYIKSNFDGKPQARGEDCGTETTTRTIGNWGVQHRTVGNLTRIDIVASANMSTGSKLEVWRIRGSSSYRTPKKQAADCITSNAACIGHIHYGWLLAHTYTSIWATLTRPPSLYQVTFSGTATNTRNRQDYLAV
jgi:hypothetical protein